ncbi:MAG: hypothetical protein KTR31_15040 [Myxococcales bacterium]|nr:hypothetical protein [Myxococcales bacterium]
MGLRGTAAGRPVADALQRLSWHLRLAGERKLLSRGDLDRAHQAVNTVRGMLHLPRTPVPAAPREEPTH